jgi:N-acetylmuramoyl-L-alanine amidase
MSSLRIRWYGLFIMCWASVATAETHIHDIRVSPYDAETTRIVLDVSGDIKTHDFLLTNPTRFVVDIQNAINDKVLKDIPLNQSMVTQVRAGIPDTTTLRLVFDLTQPVKAQHFILPSEHSQQRLVFDLKNTAKIVSAPVITPSETYPKAISTALNLKSHKGRDVTVILDAGHGGKDPGAHGRAGTQEKTVVLAIAQELKRLIDAQPGMQAILTRDGNYYVPLRNRLQKARQEKGDVFISIHADAFNNPESSGASVYALSLKGASSEAARWLAEKENYSELGQVNLANKDDVLRSVLIDLSQTAPIRSSLELGSMVLKNLSQMTKLHHSNVEQARFVVLKSPDIPSILIETGFISNPREEERLRSPAYQKQLAQSIVRGINGYFRYRAPPGTWLAQHYGQYQEFRA